MSDASKTTDPATLTATDAAKRLASGALTAEALTAACLARIRLRDADVEAWAHFDASKVMAEAKASDAARKRGEKPGPLAGIPVAIKDIIDTADYPTEHGTPVFAGRQPEKDASLVAQLKSAGATIFGKTVTTELAFFGPGKTKNPHNPGHTPGGSSSGSAAAVADFQVPLSIGTQTAGSLIRPASYCGVIGFKPTFGAVSRTGVLEQSAPLDTIGGYARSVEDIALLMDAISGFDATDADMTAGPRLSLVAELAKPAARAPRA
ncbi:MAG: amidase, partial [Hyphomicrobium sp.]